MGREENKCVLVNIQDVQHFSAHCLNRDVWKDKEIMPLMMEHFIFCQWERMADNAKRIINLYAPQSFPCIFVLNHTTGRKEHEIAVPAPDKVPQVKGKIVKYIRQEKT